MPVWLEKPVLRRKGPQFPSPNQVPTLASHFLCVATLQTRGEQGEEGLAGASWGSGRGDPLPSPQAL